MKTIKLLFLLSITVIAFACGDGSQNQNRDNDQEPDRDRDNMENRQEMQDTVSTGSFLPFFTIIKDSESEKSC